LPKLDANNTADTAHLLPFTDPWDDTRYSKPNSAERRRGHDPLPGDSKSCLCGKFDD